MRELICCRAARCCWEIILSPSAPAASALFQRNRGVALRARWYGMARRAGIARKPMLAAAAAMLACHIGATSPGCQLTYRGFAGGGRARHCRVAGAFRGIRRAICGVGKPSSGQWQLSASRACLRDHVGPRGIAAAIASSRPFPKS